MCKPPCRFAIRINMNDSGWRIDFVVTEQRWVVLWGRISTAARATAVPKMATARAMSASSWTRCFPGVRFPERFHFLDLVVRSRALCGKTPTFVRSPQLLSHYYTIFNNQSSNFLSYIKTKAQVYWPISCRGVYLINSWQKLIS